MKGNKLLIKNLIIEGEQFTLFDLTFNGGYNQAKTSLQLSNGERHTLSVDGSTHNSTRITGPFSARIQPFDLHVLQGFGITRNAHWAACSALGCHHDGIGSIIASNLIAKFF